jgi:hypothetical protein
VYASSGVCIVRVKLKLLKYACIPVEQYFGGILFQSKIDYCKSVNNNCDFRLIYLDKIQM